MHHENSMFPQRLNNSHSMEYIWSYNNRQTWSLCPQYHHLGNQFLNFWDMQIQLILELWSSQNELRLLAACKYSPSLQAGPIYLASSPTYQRFHLNPVGYPSPQQFGLQKLNYTTEVLQLWSLLSKEKVLGTKELNMKLLFTGIVSLHILRIQS